MASTRWLALKAISAVDKGRLAQAALDASGLSGPDRSFVSDIFYGCLRARLRLRHILALPQPEKLPPDMRIALEMAVYSLFFQDKAVDYAVVNETVSYVKKRFGQRMANVANAVLRNLSAPEQLQSGASLAACALHYAMPEEIALLWQKAWGRETAMSLMARSFKRPHACLRINLRKPGSAALLAALCACPEAERVGAAGVAFAPGMLPGKILNHDLAYWQKKGLLSWQGAGSQLALENLDLYRDWRAVPVWDACAGFGGKSLAMLENGLSISMASDINPNRLAHMPKQCARLALPVPAIIAASAANPPARVWEGNIIADVPCSGLGVLARRPDIKARFSLAQMRGFVHLQSRILTALTDCLKPGRELVYMTCALNPAENGDQINKLLAIRADMEIL